MTDPVTIRTHVPVAPDAAWDAYTDPVAIMAWNQASADWHCPAASVDLRPGGRHVVRMEARDGSFGFDLEGSYDLVDPPHAVTLRLADGRLARTTFRADGAGTEVTTIFDPEATHPVPMQRDGWQAILDSYAAHVWAKGQA